MRAGATTTTQGVCLKVGSEEASDLLREALAYHESIAAAAAGPATSSGGGGGTPPSARAQLAPTGVRGASGVLGIRGGGTNAAAAAAAAAASSDDEPASTGGGRRRDGTKASGDREEGDACWSSSDSSFSDGGSESRDAFRAGSGFGNAPSGGDASAGAGAAGCLTDDNYDASASSAGELSDAAVLGGALPPHRRWVGAAASASAAAAAAARPSKQSARRERERSSRRAQRGNHPPGGGGGNNSGNAGTAGGGNGSGGHGNTAEAVRSLGMPPSILIPLPPAHEDGGTATDGETATATHAIAVPSALLPPGNASWDAPAVCRTCLHLGDEWRLRRRPVVVLLLRSGRFAGGVFRSDDGRCLAHRTCARYTVRRGQGGAQSTNDGGKGKAKSMGAQLRRAGEQGLREDVAATLWEWKAHVDRAALVLLSCPKTMRKGLHEEGETATFLPRDDERIRRVPLDVGRPTFEAVTAVHEVMMTMMVRPITEQERLGMESTTSYDLSTEAEAEVEAEAGGEGNNKSGEKGRKKQAAAVEQEKKQRPEKEAIPLTTLHEAVIAGDIDHVMDLLAISEAADASEAVADDADQIDARAGEDLQTPLHYAAALPERDVAAEIVTALLVDGGANPCVVDARNRPPYFLAGNEKVRDAFRSARATLGEAHCDWDGGAKVPSPLTQDDVQKKKDKAAEKKRRQRARQKEKKAAEKAAEEARLQKEKEEAEAKRQEEDAKRIRAGLKPKTTTASNACDYCQKVCKGKKRSQMFSRLEYVYCSTDCVRKHQRELTASAAMARFG